MRVLILGIGGMLGHKLCQQFGTRYDTWGTVRGAVQDYERYDLLEPSHILGGVDAFDFASVESAIATVQPDVVVNCIGIIKQLPTAKDPLVSITINSLLPHQLARVCQDRGARLVHFSTDCVFSGTKGMYAEDDPADAQDLYGRTKFLGETHAPGCLTIRSSIIGRELATTSGLVEWFLNNRNGKVFGYNRAIYSGFTTQAMADILVRLIDDYADLDGLYQISSAPINKYDLLCMIRTAMHLNIDIEPQSEFVIDRSLDSSRFWDTVEFTAPSWRTMIADMAADLTPYDEWRENSCI